MKSLKLPLLPGAQAITTRAKCMAASKCNSPTSGKAFPEEAATFPNRIFRSFLRLFGGK
jgi:hypothetical protein